MPPPPPLRLDTPKLVTTNDIDEGSLVLVRVATDDVDDHDESVGEGTCLGEGPAPDAAADAAGPFVKSKLATE